MPRTFKKTNDRKYLTHKYINQTKYFINKLFYQKYMYIE